MRDKDIEKRFKLIEERLDKLEKSEEKEIFKKDKLLKKGTFINKEKLPVVECKK